MFKHLVFSVILCYVATIATCLAQGPTSQIARGALPNEIYISTDWYITNFVADPHIHYAIFRSTDNGENISIQYHQTSIDPPEVMRVGSVIGGSLEGVLYNKGFTGNNTLWVSFDYGQTWTYRENFGASTYYYASDFDGVLYKNSAWDIFQSDDYALSFEYMSDFYNWGISTFGHQLGEIYGIGGDVCDQLTLVHTMDYAQTYTEISIDSAVAYTSISGNYPKIFHGTEPSEIYLTAWWPDYTFTIHHSVDSGYTWTQQYRSEFIDLYSEIIDFTAGREPGSFYILKRYYDSDFLPEHRIIEISYSNDYAQTFTTYTHELDSTVYVQELQKEPITLVASPNPFSNYTTINIPQQIKDGCTEILIYNNSGQLINTIKTAVRTSIVWEGTTQNGTKAPCGIYFCRIMNENQLLALAKVVLTK